LVAQHLLAARVDQLYPQDEPVLGLRQVAGDDFVHALQATQAREARHVEAAALLLGRLGKSDYRAVPLGGVRDLEARLVDWFQQRISLPLADQAIQPARGAFA